MDHRGPVLRNHSRVLLVSCAETVNSKSSRAHHYALSAPYLLLGAEVCYCVFCQGSLRAHFFGRPSTWRLTCNTKSVCFTREAVTLVRNVRTFLLTFCWQMMYFSWTFLLFAPATIYSRTDLWQLQRLDFSFWQSHEHTIEQGERFSNPPSGGRVQNSTYYFDTRAKTLLLFCSTVNCLFSSSHSTAEPPHRYERDKWEAHWRTQLNINLKLQVLVLPCLWFLSINLLAAVVSVYGSSPASW